jgi:hypothetical protein
VLHRAPGTPWWRCDAQDAAVRAPLPGATGSAAVRTTIGATVRTTIGATVCSAIGTAVRATICTAVRTAVVLARHARRAAVGRPVRAAVGTAVGAAVVLSRISFRAAVGGPVLVLGHISSSSSRTVQADSSPIGAEPNVTAPQAASTRRSSTVAP